MADNKLEHLVGKKARNPATGEMYEIIAVINHPRLGPLITLRANGGAPVDLTPEAFYKYWEVR